MRNVTALLITIAFLQTACTKFASTGASDRERGCAGTDCTVIANRFKAVTGIAKQSQIFPALQSCLALPDSAVSAQTKSVYQTIKSNFSAEGNLNDVNAPMLMALTQLAGEFCSDTIKFEVTGSSRNFFGRFDIYPATGPVTVTGGDQQVEKPSIEATISKLAKSCWGREPMKFEVETIRESFAKSSVGSNNDKASALFLCTLTLSTPDMLIY